VWKANIEMLEGQLYWFVMLDDETPQEMYYHMKHLVKKVRAYGSKRWNNRVWWLKGWLEPTPYGIPLLYPL
jgi:hypothetical protein